MPLSDEFVVLVLAAGRGRRMGGPKALMDADGVAWWRRQCSRLNAASAPAVWVVSPTVEAAMRSQPDAPACRVVAPDGAPMMHSVLAGLESLGTTRPDRVLVLPVDVPSPRPTTIEHLRTGGPVVVPSFRGRRGHPLGLAWNWIEANLLIDRDAIRDARLDHLTATDVCTIDVEDPCVARNLNTPEDLATWLNSPDSRC